MSSSRGWLVGVLLMAVSRAAAGQAPGPAPMSDEARVHYDRGLALYGAKDFAGAIRELEAGYALDPRREFLFAEAQAHRLGGDCHRAVPLYQRFLATGPSDAHVNAAQMGLARCAQQMATAPPVVLPTPVAPALPALPPPAPPAPWYRDRVGGALLTGGVVGLGVGTWFLIASTGPAQGSGYDDYDARHATLEQRRTIGLVASTAGALLAGGAALRYHQQRRAQGVPTTTVGAVATPTGAALVVEGRF